MNWLKFIRERFEPVSHLLMISFFVAVHGAAARSIFSVQPALGPVLLAFSLALLFFFKLRLYDEIKDYETDLEFNPTRPLARGLLTVRQLERVIALILVFEVTILFFAGDAAAVCGTIAIVYSLLMYKEFFIGRWLRPLLTTYAMTHTIVCSMLSATLLAAFTQKLPHTIQEWSFIFASWFLFNVFEFGRKTFASIEERDRVPSYSKVFGRRGALVLVLAQLALSTVFYVLAFDQVSIRIALLISWFVVLVVGVNFLNRNDIPSAKTYRHVTSLSIVLQQAALLAVFMN